MIDNVAKEYLHEDLRWARRSLLSKLEGVSEYDLRRPMTRTGTNLLGLVKHLALCEARYFGDVFGRPFPEPVPRFDDPGYANRDHLWARPGESRADIIDGYQRACRHADATIDALAIDAPGFVAWWPRPQVTLFNVMVHVLTETNRHAGHADIVRELLDGAVGDGPAAAPRPDDTDWEAHRSQLEKAARDASSAPCRLSGNGGR